MLTVALLLCFAHGMQAQCALARISGTKICGAVQGKPLLPEDGYLSTETYTSLFFGFSLDLPITTDGHLITIPVMPEKHHALLAIGFEEEKRFGTLTVTAEESPRELEEYQDEQQKQCDTTGSSAPPVRRHIPELMLRYGSFYARMGQRGKEHTQRYWLRLKTYIIRVEVDSNDQEFLRKSKRAMIEAEFYCGQDASQLTTREGKAAVVAGQAYQGPTVPTSLVDAAIKDKPGAGIPAGEISDGVYRNPDLGLEYEFPTGWDILQAEEDGEVPQDARQQREYELLHACSRTLLRVEQHGSGDAVREGATPSIILRTLDLTCLSMRTPASPEDKKVASKIAGSLELFSEFGEIKSFDLSLLGNRLFMVFHGTVGLRAPGEALSRRMSESLFATQHHGMLLIWSLMAPSAAELNVFPASNITFDDSHPVSLPPHE